MPRNIFEALNATPDGGAPKNAFDLHNFNWMTSKAGQFLPVGCRECVPDGTYRMSVDNYTMTFPCNTASQADMKENYYFIFIPYYLLTRTAYSFFPQRKDNHSALDYQIQQMPWFPLGDVVEYCISRILKYEHGYPISNFRTDVHGNIVHYGALRLLDLLGYGCYLDILDKCRDIWSNLYPSHTGYELPAGVQSFLDKVKANLNNYKPNALRLAAYQKAWYCYFRNSTYDNNISPKSFNFDDVTYPSDTTYNILDYREMIDFVSDCLQLRYVQNKKDVVSASMPGTQFGAVSSIPLNIDLTNLGGSFVGTPSTIASTGTVQVYGSTDFDKNHHLGFWNNEEDHFSEATQQQIDDYLSDGTPSGRFIPTERISQLSPGGHFQSVKLSPTYIPSGVHLNLMAEPGQRNPELYNFHSHYFNKQFPLNVNGSYTPQGTVRISGGSSQSTLFDVLQITEAQAIQKWRQKSMMAGQKVKDQWKAHYGTVPDHMADDYPDFIGSVDNPIQISQVVSQANTEVSEDRSNLGDIAGRGYGASSEKTFEYHAREYGVLILFRSVVAENVYSSYGLDRANQLIYYTDFYQPEFQNIGLEAVPKLILQSFKPTSQTTDPTGTGGSTVLPSTSTVIGYAPRNYQLKAYRSRVHGLFNPSRFTHLNLSDPSVHHPFGFGELEAFVQVRRDVIQGLDVTVYSNDVAQIAATNVPITRSQLYVNPSVTNSTFGFDADAREDTDVFIHKTRFNCEAVQPLSVLGLPQF